MLKTNIVPYQEKSWDCGVYTCRYAPAILQSWDMPFTFSHAKNNNNFQILITNNHKFKFSGIEITAMRLEMSLLIMNLSSIYQTLKAQEKETGKVKPIVFSEEDVVEIVCPQQANVMYNNYL